MMPTLFDDVEKPIIGSKHPPICPVADEVIEQIATKWRERGFPHYLLSDEERLHQFNLLKNFDCVKLLEGGTVKQTLHALGLAWHYFPHHWDVRVGKMKTAVDVWNDDDLFCRAIRSRIKWGGYLVDTSGTADLSAADMRKALRTFSGVQRVSNFRPSAARAIYDHFAAGTVWDMSCGYGGRLLGAMTSKSVDHYIGTEPAKDTIAGLSRIIQDFATHTATKVTIHKTGAETFTPEPNSCSLCFTSPPYFNTEKYSDEPTQSWKQYATPHEWNEGFLRRTIQNCHIALENNGHLIINIANVKSHKTLEADTMSIAQEEGFTLKSILHLSLSSINNGGFKYEPMFVFTKRKTR